MKKVHLQTVFFFLNMMTFTSVFAWAFIELKKIFAKQDLNIKDEMFL